MPATASTFLNTAPEQIPITLNQTVINLDADAVISRQERFKLGLPDPFDIYDNGTGQFKYFELVYTPVNADGVVVFKNGVQQRKGTDYFINGKEVFLSTAATSDDDFTVTYLTVTTVQPSTAVPSSFPLGSVVDYEYNGDLSLIPTGWLALENTTAHAQAAFSALFAYLQGAGAAYLESSDATTFHLKNITNAAYRDGVIVTVTRMIKAT